MNNLLCLCSGRQQSGHSIEGSLCRAGHGTRPDQRDFPGQIGTVGNYDDDKNDTAIGTLLAMSLDFSECDRFLANCGLACFRSQLVLVVRVERETSELTNKLWSSEDGSDWEPSLPPMRVMSFCPSAVSVGDPECLVMVSGFPILRNSGNTDVVEVLKGEQWFKVQPLPMAMHAEASVYNGNLIALDELWPSGYCCRVEELLESCSRKN